MLRLCVVLLACLSVFCIGRQSIDVGKKPVPREKVSYSGGSGESFEDAVVIQGPEKQSEGVKAEYDYISGKHGIKNKDWVLVGQTISKEKKKVVDMVEINLTGSNEHRIYYFDISSLPWK